MTGHFAAAMAGHDKGSLYVIVGEDGTYVYLCDGSLRSLARPKKKNRRHIRIMRKTVDRNILNRLLKKEPVFDHEIKYAIKQYLASVSSCAASEGCPAGGNGWALKGE